MAINQCGMNTMNMLSTMSMLSTLPEFEHFVVVAPPGTPVFANK
jgi:hypothetical protein